MIPSNHKQAERLLILAVKSGELSIDDNGFIWRHFKRGGIRSGGSILRKCKKPIRAEHKTPEYLMIRNTINKKRIYGVAHRLIWQYYNGNIPNGLTINHKNGIKSDNHLSNLELATYSQQSKHTYWVLGKRSQKGEKNNMAKLTQSKVNDIRCLRKNGLLLRKIADKFNISFQTVSKIVNYERWK